MGVEPAEVFDVRFALLRLIAMGTQQLQIVGFIRTFF